MPPRVVSKESWYKKITPYIKDAIYIIGIVASLIGWISAKSESKTLLETTVKYNTEAVKKLEDFMTKQVEFNGKQMEINGTLMEFKNSHTQ